MSEGRKDSDGRTGQMDRRRTGKIEKHVPPDKSGIAVDNTQNGDTNRDGGEARKAPAGEQPKSSWSGRRAPEQRRLDRATTETVVVRQASEQRRLVTKRW